MAIKKYVKGIYKLPSIFVGFSFFIAVNAIIYNLMMSIIL